MSTSDTSDLGSHCLLRSVPLILLLNMAATKKEKSQTTNILNEYYHLHKKSIKLIFTHSLGKVGKCKLIIFFSFFFFFFKKMGSYLSCKRDNLHEMSVYFLEKIRKSFQKMLSANFFTHHAKRLMPCKE